MKKKVKHVKKIFAEIKKLNEEEGITRRINAGYKNYDLMVNGCPTCPKCGSMFTELSGCYQHMRNVHGLKPRTKRSPNLIVVFKSCAAVILYDNNSDVVAATLIDVEDVKKVSKYKWSVDHIKRNKPYYVNGNQISRKLHTFLLPNAPEGYTVDHINRNTLDNRRKNLRYATRQLQQQNRDLYECKHRRTDLDSGQKGVMWDKSCEKWKVFIKNPYTGKRKHYGYFSKDELQEAVKKAQEVRATFGLSIN